MPNRDIHRHSKGNNEHIDILLLEGESMRFSLIGKINLSASIIRSVHHTQIISYVNGIDSLFSLTRDTLALLENEMTGSGLSMG